MRNAWDMFFAALAELFSFAYHLCAGMNSCATIAHVKADGILREEMQKAGDLTTLKADLAAAGITFMQPEVIQKRITQEQSA